MISVTEYHFDCQAHLTAATLRPVPALCTETQSRPLIYLESLIGCALPLERITKRNEIPQTCTTFFPFPTAFAIV